MGRGPVELVVQPGADLLQRRRHRAVAERPVDVGDVAVGLLDDPHDVAGDADLDAGRRGSSRARSRRPTAAPGRAASSRSAWKTGTSRIRPSTTPRCRAPIVQPPWMACGERPASAACGERGDGQPEPEPDQHLRRAASRPSDAPGSSPRPARPPATSSEPVAASATRAAHADARRRERRDGHRRDDHGGLQRLDPPPLDEQQHEQEQRRRERGRQQRQRRQRRHVRPSGGGLRRGRGRLAQREQRARARSAPAAGRSTPSRRAA